MPTTHLTLARTALRGAGSTLRPATLDDIAWTARLETERDPADPTNEESLAHWWRSTDVGRTDDRWIVLEDGRPIGFASFGHPAWDRTPMRAARLAAHFAPGAERAARLRKAFDLLEPFAVADGTAVFVAGTVETFEDEYDALVAHGYKEERRSRSWELDLAAHRATIEMMTDEARARMRDEGIEITTIDRVADPEKWRKLHTMCEASVQDIPTTVPHAPESFESFMQWMSAPGMHADRLWVAREGTAIVGMSVLDYPPGIGNVWTDYTGTSRSVRGRGIARALKCETVTQAISLGVKRVRTNNDWENKPILHLNEEMGYSRIPGHIQLLKPAPES